MHVANTILVIDDDPVQRRLLQAAISRLGHEVVLASGGQDGVAAIAGAPAGTFGAIILDLMMDDLDGLGVLSHLRQMHCPVPVIVQTAQGGIDTVVGAMRAGAFDFVVKPVSPDRVRAAIENALKLGAHKAEIGQNPPTPADKSRFRDIVGTSTEMARVIRIAEKAAASSIPVLIEGESGVGKELMARAIRNASARRKKPFITVNCGALPENLVESILFGHEKGAFTGATDKHVGRFEEANGGTLFLDEIGELPFDMQVKLLRAIQEGEIDPIGSRKPVKVDVRIVSATNRNLLEEVKAGRFREDLFYRLSVLPVLVPPLRARRGDVPALAAHFVARYCEIERRGALLEIDAAAIDALCRYDWPGNIRELENAMFRAVVLADGASLTLEDFPQIAAQLPGFELPAPEFAAKGVDLGAGSHEPAQPQRLQPLEIAGCMSLLTLDGQVRALVDIEEEMIRFAIAHYDGRMAEVARRLGIGRSTLYRKLKDYGLEQYGEAGEENAA